MIIPGQYLDGKQSKSQTAKLSIVNDEIFKLTRTDNEQESQLNFLITDLEIESRLGNTPRQIFLPDNQVFSTTDHHQINNLQRLYSPSVFKTLIYRIESHFLLAIVAVLISISTIYAVTQYGIPKAAELISHNIPIDSLGDHSLTILDETLFEPSNLDTEEKERIQRLVKPYLENYIEIKPKLSFRSGMPANALALPDGNIIFTDEFVKLASEDGELISVLFHEIGHIKNRHVTRRAIQGTALTILVFFITGDLEIFDFAAAIPAALMDLSYSREFEREADRFSIQEMKKNGLDLSHFINIMTKLEDSHHDIYNNEKSNDTGKSKDSFRIPEFFSTHPLTEERIKLFNES